MRAFARHLAVTALFVAGCSSDSPDRDYGDTTDPVDTGDAGTEPADGSDDGEPSVPDGEANEDGEADGSDLPPNDDPADVCRNGSEALARGVSIRDVAIYQAVKIDLVENGVWSTNRNSPVVQGKKALVRVFLDTGADYQIHALNGVLTIENDGLKKYLTDGITPTGPSSDEAPNSTLNFDVDAADIGPSTTFSVAVVETTCPAQLGASTARFPSEGGTRALEATKIGKLRVVVVPFTINGITPDTNAEQLEGMRQAMLAYYPVPDVEISARPPINWARTVRADGTGWSDTLNEVANLRYEDGVDDDVYYYGVMTPESSFNSFCRQGCVLGLAPQTTWISPDQQVGLGIGFINEETFTTMVHELGHAHGRGHAPCGGPAGVDRNFPNSNANIDTWGWDSRTGTLQLPTYKDVMAYCSPAWISPYTYSALAERCSDVNVAFSVAPSSARWNSMVLYADGTARWGRTRTTRLPGGEDETALVKGANGESLGEVRVVRVRLSHAEDSFLYVPDPKPEWATLVLGDREIPLSSVQPAL